jgi:hypothetical protein
MGRKWSAAKAFSEVEDRIEAATNARSPTVTLNTETAYILLAVIRHLPNDAFWLAEKLRGDAETLEGGGYPIKAARVIRAANAIERIGISAAL